MNRSLVSAFRRSHPAPGFAGVSTPVASARLMDTVVAVLALSSLSLTLAAAFTLLSIDVSMALPG